MILNGNLLSDEASEQIKARVDLLLQMFPDPKGAVIIGVDGNIAANYAPNDVDIEPVRTTALTVFKNARRTSDTIEEGSLPYAVIATSTKGTLIIYDFGAGLIALLSDCPDTRQIARAFDTESFEP